jgi:hypothetical protein
MEDVFTAYSQRYDELLERTASNESAAAVSTSRIRVKASSQ